MKSKHEKILIILLFIITATVFFGPPVFVKYSITDRHLYRIYPDKSKSHYAVVFHQGAMQGTSIHFGVIDESKSKPKLIILGSIDHADGPCRFVRGVISADKTVVAAESEFNPYRGAGTKTYWLAYDFTNSISYGGAWNPSDEDPNLVEVRGNAILKLLQSRGGIGQEFSCDFKKENKLSHLSWILWQRKVDKAKEKCKPWVPVNTTTQSN